MDGIYLKRITESMAVGLLRAALPHWYGDSSDLRFLWAFLGCGMPDFTLLTESRSHDRSETNVKRNRTKKRSATPST